MKKAVDADKAAVVDAVNDATQAVDADREAVVDAVLTVHQQLLYMQTNLYWICDATGGFACKAVGVG